MPKNLRAGSQPTNDLGLDLQGGSHLLLEVDVPSVLAQRREALVDSVRDGLRRGSPRIGHRRLGVRDQCVGFDLLREADRDRVVEICSLNRMLSIHFTKSQPRANLILFATPRLVVEKSLHLQLISQLKLFAGVLMRWVLESPLFNDKERTGLLCRFQASEIRKD